MPKEIERKFLINKEKWDLVEKPLGCFFRQGYILADSEKTIRVRLAETEAFLTIKSKTVGISRNEYEYEIPTVDAVELLDKFAISELSKVRYNLVYADKIWEIDVFLGENEGLIIAEIELSSEDESFKTPDWISLEVTGDARYYNSNLSKEPYKKWKN